MRKTISPRRFLSTYRRNQAVAKLNLEAVGKVARTAGTGERADISVTGEVKRRFRSIAFAAFAVFLVAQIVVVTPAQQADEPGPPPAGATEEWTAAARQAVAESEYEVNLRNVASAQNVEASYQAPNRAHHLRSHFTPDAVRIVPRTDEGPQWELSFSLVGYGRGADVRPVDHPTLAPRGKSIDYHRGRLTEWYVNDERGLEQGFTLSGPPEDLRRGAATLRVPGRRARSQKDDGATEPAFVVLKLGGDLVPTVRSDGQAVDFAPRSGGLSVLHYAELKVVDALERELPAHMEGFSEAGVRGIRIVFDDSDAVYPVIVDPLATSAAWTGEGNRALWKAQHSSVIERKRRCQLARNHENDDGRRPDPGKRQRRDREDGESANSVQNYPGPYF